MNAYLNQYHSQHVLTASPEQLLVMHYDAAIRFVNKAKLAVESNDLQNKITAIGKAIAIISELSNTLDFEIGGEIAENLDGLYGFMMRELTQANLSNDSTRMQGVETMLRDLRETWMQAIEQVRKEKATATSVAASESVGAFVAAC